MPGRFNIDEYRRLVRALGQGRRPLCRFYPRPQTGLLLRLDVDYDLGWAAMTAAVNAEEGVHATYFVLVASDLYNPASERGRTALAGIAGHGQSIGLHYHHRGGALDRQRLAHEFANLRHLVPRAEPIIAWHNPEGELAPLTLAAVDAGFVFT